MSDLVKWEELPNLDGKEVKNTATDEIVKVNWDNGYPEYIDSHNKRNIFVCAEFAHACKLYVKI